VPFLRATANHLLFGLKAEPIISLFRDGRYVTGQEPFLGRKLIRPASLEFVLKKSQSPEELNWQSSTNLFRLIVLCWIVDDEAEADQVQERMRPLL
jgi:hypothetical protein